MSHVTVPPGPPGAQAGCRTIRLSSGIAMKSAPMAIETKNTGVKIAEENSPITSNGSRVRW